MIKDSKTATASGHQVQRTRRTCINSSSFSGGRSVITSKELSIPNSVFMVNWTTKEYYQKVSNRLEEPIKEIIQNEIIENIWDNLRLSLINNLKSNVDEITAEAESFVASNSLLFKVLNKIVFEISRCVATRYGKYKLNLFMSTDYESELKELVFSVQIDENNFENRDKFWNEIGQKAENIVDNLQSSYVIEEDYESAKELVDIDNMFSLEVTKLENV